MNQPMRILVADHDPIVAESLADFLRGEGYATATACGGGEVLTALDDAEAGGEPFGIAVLDIDMPGHDGIQLLRRLRQQHGSLVVIAVTRFGKIETAVQVVKLGVVDYLTKPIVDDELRLAVSKAQNQHVLVVENETLRTQLCERYGVDNLVGTDYRMQKVFELIEAVAPSKTSVLISGESGTGKTVAARAIHALSDRRSGPFVTFSCGAIPETLLESELFGHVRGAFTGADYDKPGKCLAADGGTLFIDEINSATPALQLKLLRVLQEKAFEPVGSTETKRVDVRFVLATNQSLVELVEGGSFREDLYYRINVVNIHLPALRDRSADVPLLAEHFLQHHCREMHRQRCFSDEAMRSMRTYAWPGNVRELENAVERAVVLSRGPTITVDDLPEQMRTTTDREARHEAGRHASHNGHASHPTGGAIHVPALVDGWTPTPLAEAMVEPERQVLLAALEANQWNRQATAGQLGINRTTLYKKIKQHRLDEPV